MSRFCTRCGTVNDAQSRFCDHCGHAFKAQKRSPAPPEAGVVMPPSPPARSRLPLKWLGAGVLALLLAGGGAAWWLQPQAASAPVFATAIDRYVAVHPAEFQERVCLKNFAYEKDPVFTSTYDQTTNAWLGELVKAGLYTAPQAVNNGFVSQLSYSQTARGKAAIKDGKLCLAGNIQVTGVSIFTPVQTLAGMRFSRATFQYQLRASAPWVDGVILQQLQQQSGPADPNILLILKDRVWAVPDADSARALNQAANDLQQSANAALESSGSGAPGGLLSLVRQLFASSQPSAPEVWQALLNVMPSLSQYQDSFSVAACQRQDSAFACQVHLNGQTQQVIMSKDANGAWVARPS